MEPGEAWTIERGELPIIATAIHAGHGVRPEVADLFEISEGDRLREEDPFTDRWTEVAFNRVIVHRSRFEVDLNRPRDKAIFRTPEDAWGLTVWKNGVPEEVFQRSLAQYDRFYEAMRALLKEFEAAHGKFVVFDLHSYNHRRGGPEGARDARAHWRGR